MDVTLSITSSDLVPEKLQELASNLSRTLNRETAVGATLPEQSGRAGTKGDPITAGIILLEFLSSGAAVALFNVLKSYFERSNSLEMEFQRGDNKKLIIRAENVKSKEIDRTIELARDFFEDSV